MKSVKQQTATDCLRACIASLMEMDPARLPSFDGDAPGQWSQLERFMAEEFLRPVAIPKDAFVVPYNAHYLMIGESARGLRHACIGLNGKLVHDPHPDDTGLASLEYYIVFVGFLVESEGPYS